MTTRALTFYGTTIGKKVAMAVSGLIVVGWLFAHMLGNVTIFAGPEAVNHYAALLRHNPPILWGQRIVVLVAIVLHMHAAFALWAVNNDARPRSYYQRKNLATDYAALTMRYGGITILLFIFYHLAHLTFGETQHLGYEFDPENVYANVVQGFAHPAVAGLYILAQCALAMHLYHGIWSLTQTLGVEHPKLDKLRKGAAVVLTLIIVLGFVSIPVAVQLGTLPQPDQIVEAPDAAEVETP
jgi:succinate dehydrogenase / fumarate reductase cytochrome b subunit